MNIFVPFTALRAETWDAVWPMYGATLVPLLDSKAYSRYFMRRWEETKTFINIEHDVVPTLAQLQELWNCPHPWCACGYTGECVTPYLGCAKISTEFILTHPDMWVEREWGNLDVYMADRAKLPFHLHPAVRHVK